MRLSFIAALCCGVTLSCAPSGDLTVSPPSVVPAEFKVKLPPPSPDGRLPAWVQPRGYRLHMHIDPAAKRFHGDVVIDVSTSRPSAVFVLHAAGLEVTRAEVVTGADRLRADATARTSAGGHEAQELIVVAAREVAAGDSSLHLEFSGALGEQLRGLYRASEGGRAFAFTQFEPTDARRMFPCFDDPAYKVPFELRVTAPKGNLVVANTPEIGRQPSADGSELTFSFAPSKPLPTYLTALAVGPLEVRRGASSPVPVRLLAVPGKTALGAAALDAASAHLTILADYLGRPYPYRKLDLMAVPNFGPGAMENAGFITFREELLLVDEQHGSVRSRRDMATAVAHELAHQWLGNLVTMRWWNDLWLNEGFATYLESLVVDRWRPSMRAELESLSASGWVMDFDALESARAVRQPVSNTSQALEAFDAITYLKGASIIGMVNRWIGEEAFRAGLRAYLAEHAWKNATSDDLFAALSAASGQQVGVVASTFLDQPGVPLVRASTTCQPGKGAVVTLSQQRYRGRAAVGAVANDALWKIPVCVEYSEGPRHQVGQACTLLSERSGSLALPSKRCPDWVLPNAGYRGYYRFALDEVGLARLIASLNKQDATHQIGLLSNLWALVQAGEVPADKLMAALASLRGERDRLVVDELVNKLERIEDALIEPSVRPRFRAFVAALLLPTAKRLGWDARAGEGEDAKLLRRSVLGALGVLADDAWVARQAAKRARAFLAAPGTDGSDTATIALRVAARHGAEGVDFDHLLGALKDTSRPGRRVVLVQALGSLPPQAGLAKALGLVVDGTIRAQDALYIMRSAVSWPDSRAVFIEWLEHNLAEVARRYPGFGVGRMLGTLRRLCDASARTMAAKTFTPLVRSIGGYQRRLDEALEASELCIDLRARQAATTSAYLRRRRHW